MHARELSGIPMQACPMVWQLLGTTHRPGTKSTINETLSRMRGPDPFQRGRL